MSQEKSPGGSAILRYIQSRWAKPEVGIPDELAQQFAEMRAVVYRSLFGEALDVYHEVIPLLPHIDVFTYKRSSSKGDVYVMVTSGMSDARMHVPRGAGDAPRRAELIFYCSEPKPEYRETLRWVARFPHDQKTFLGYGHTLPNGNPPAPLWGSTVLDTLLFMPPIVLRDQKLPEQLILDKDPVHFLWVVPLSTPECELKLQKGFEAILDLFQEHRHPHVFDPERRSYV